MGNLASPVDTVVWATVGSGAATSCLPNEMCKNLDLNVKPVVEKPFTNASGQPGQCTALAVPWSCWERRTAHVSKEWGRSEQWTLQSHCCQCPRWLNMVGQSTLDQRDPTFNVGSRRFRLCRPVAFSRSPWIVMGSPQKGWRRKSCGNHRRHGQWRWWAGQ